MPAGSRAPLAGYSSSKAPLVTEVWVSPSTGLPDGEQRSPGAMPTPPPAAVPATGSNFFA